MDVIERLRALEQAATPGPWTWVEPHSVIHDVETEVAPRVEVPVAAIEGLFRMRHANGELIAAMRNAFPALLDVVEAASDVLGLDSSYNGDGGSRYPALAAALAALDKLP